MAFSAAAAASSGYLTGRIPSIQGSDPSTVAVRYTVDLATADLASGIVGAVGILPAGHIPVGFEIDAPQLDSNGTPTFAYSVGILNAAGTDLSTAAADGGAAWATGQVIGRTAGGSASGLVASRPVKLVTQTQTDRLVAIKTTGAAATAVAGTFAITLHYRPA